MVAPVQSTPISQMTTAVALTGAELVPLVQSGANVKATLDTIGTYVIGSNTNIRPANLALQWEGAADTASWNLSDQTGASISTTGTTTQGLQEALNTAFALGSGGTHGPSYDLDIIGGDRHGQSGVLGGAAYLALGGGISVPVGHGKSISTGAASIGAMSFDSQMMTWFETRGSQIFGVTFQPVSAAELDGSVNAIVDSRFRFQSLVGPMVFDFSDVSSTGVGYSEFSVQELNPLNASAVALDIPTIVGGRNFMGNNLHIHHIHDYTAGGTAVRVGQAGPTPGQVMGLNLWDVSFVAPSGASTGFDTWGSDDLIFLRGQSLTTGETLKFRSGANYNVALIGSDQTVPIVTDDGTGNIVIGAGKLSIGAGVSAGTKEVEIAGSDSSAFTASGAPPSQATIRVSNFDLTASNLASLAFGTKDANGALATAASIQAQLVSHAANAVTSVLHFQIKTAGTLSAPVGINNLGLIDTNGNQILRFSAQANAVNYLQLSNAAVGQNNLALNAIGSDSQINFFVNAKGVSGFVQMGGNNGTGSSLRVQGSGAATVTNGVVVSAASAGAAPVIVTSDLAGTGDTNIDLKLGCAGSGVINFNTSGSWSANASIATALSSVGPTGSHTTVQEWFTVKNASGVVRYIPAF